MSQRQIIKTPGGELRFEFSWGDMSAQGIPCDATYGRLALWLSGNLVWGDGGAAIQDGPGIPGLWIEVLEYLSNYWLYLVLEQGYPFNVTPDRPSQLDTALESRWDQWDDQPRQANEEEIAYAFKLSHNLAESSPGALRPDFWLVREGGVFVVESQIGPRWVVERLPSADIKRLLTDVGDAIAARLENATDPRSTEAKRSWSNRAAKSDEVLAQIATGLPEDYLRQTCGADSFNQVFADPDSSWHDDNLYLDLAYHCKGVLPADKLRMLLDRARAAGGAISPALENVSQEAKAELASWETTLTRPFQQGHALARWLRQRTADLSGRVEPDALLSQWKVVVDKLDFATAAIDAVAFWAHGRQPNILWNDWDKHRTNEGALRATLSHEICHLLIDRPVALPLSAVARGAMDRKIEQRANAFAAEFLCPQSEVAAEYRHAGSVPLAIAGVTNRFGVSDALAAMQLAKSGAVTARRDQIEIERIGPPGARYPWS